MLSLNSRICPDHWKLFDIIIKKTGKQLKLEKSRPN